MKLYPAIDLYGDRVVRLIRGEFNRQKTYSTDPAAVARRFMDCGADWLHLIDLQGAEEGHPAHLHVLAALSGLNLRIQYGGGLRTSGDIESALRGGAERVYGGSIFASNPRVAKELFMRWGDRLVPAVDVKDGQVAVAGWKKTQEATPDELLSVLTEIGFRRFLMTSVSHDGTESGPDLDLYAHIAAAFPQIEIIAAGGITILDDLRALKRIGISGAVLGKSLYEKTIDLKEALEEMKEC